MKKRSYAKVNIFLKIAGKRGDYHELVSRFVIVKSLYDTVELVEDHPGKFTLIGNFGCKLEKNTIYKAYKALRALSPKTDELFKRYSLKVDKRIPEFAGLGGGSSNAAAVLNIINEACKLGLDKDELAKIGANIGADVPFFVYGYNSANVTGIGEIVKKFDEEELDIKTFTPDIKCDTGEIFKVFREKFYKEISDEEAAKLMNMKSRDILKELNIQEANDLYLPAQYIYDELKNPSLITHQTSPFFSGSGSSFFWLEESR